MDYLTRIYQNVLNFADYLLNSNQFIPAYAEVEQISLRDNSEPSWLEHVLFMGCKKMKGTKAQQKDGWKPHGGKKQIPSGERKEGPAREHPG